MYCSDVLNVTFFTFMADNRVAVKSLHLTENLSFSATIAPTTRGLQFHSLIRCLDFPTGCLIKSQGATIISNTFVFDN